MMRRRPLLRAAVVGGGAYAAGRHMASKSASGEQQAGQAAAQPSSPAPQAAGASAGSPLLDQLNQLDALHQQGALTDSEFAAAKAKLLA
jgi:putative oligomerization/nucleic acid binding protein